MRCPLFQTLLRLCSLHWYRSNAVYLIAIVYVLICVSVIQHSSHTPSHQPDDQRLRVLNSGTEFVQRPSIFESKSEDLAPVAFFADKDQPLRARTKSVITPESRRRSAEQKFGSTSESPVRPWISVKVSPSEAARGSWSGRNDFSNVRYLSSYR